MKTENATNTDYYYCMNML